MGIVRKVWLLSMRRTSGRRLQRPPLFAGLLLALSVFSHPLMAADPFHGVYKGHHDGCQVGIVTIPPSEPDFMIFVGKKGSDGSEAILLGEGFRKTAIVQSDGSFIINGNTCDSIPGTKLSKVGPASDLAGYYDGDFSGTILNRSGEGGSGRVEAIIAGTGEMFMLVKGSSGSFSAGIFLVPSFSVVGGGFVDFVADSNGGTISGLVGDLEPCFVVCGIGQVSISGRVNTTTLNANGTLSQTRTFCILFSCGVATFSGTWTVSRKLALTNAGPAAISDNYSMFKNRVLTVDAAAGVLSNDRDPDGDPQTAVLAGGASNGTLALAADGGFTYTPDKSFSGVDFFTYRASDGLVASDVASVSMSYCRKLVTVCSGGVLNLLDSVLESHSLPCGG